MMSTLRQMLTCHWSARRIQRYLDRDEAAPLTVEEIRRLEHHLAECERCRAVAEDHRILSRAFTTWSTRHSPDPATVARLRRTVDTLLKEES